MNNVSVEEKAEAQREYCKKNGLPKFAPYSGRCWACGGQIYEKISMEKAQSELITGCPHCKTSFCS